MPPEVFRNALITLYGDKGYITKFATKVGRRRLTVQRWLAGAPIPIWASLVLTLLIREKKQKEQVNG